MPPAFNGMQYENQAGAFRQTHDQPVPLRQVRSRHITLFGHPASIIIVPADNPVQPAFLPADKGNRGEAGDPVQPGLQGTVAGKGINHAPDLDKHFLGGFFRQCHVAREPEAKRKHAPGIPVVQLAKSVRVFLPEEGDQGFFTVLQVVNVVLCAWMLCV